MSGGTEWKPELRWLMRRMAPIGIQIAAATVRQARTHPPPPRRGVLAAIRLGLAIGRLEGLNTAASSTREVEDDAPENEQ